MVVTIADIAALLSQCSSILLSPLRRCEAPNGMAADKLRLLAPFLTTIQTPDKDGHRFISRPGLHLPILRLRLPAAFALEHIATSLLISL